MKPKTKAAVKPTPKKAAAAKAPAKKMAQTTLKPKAKTITSKKRSKPDSDNEQISPEDVLQNDGSVLSMTPPSAKKQKRAPAPKKTGAKPLQENENEAVNVGGGDNSKSKQAANSTDQYQKVSALFMSGYPCADNN